MPRLRVIILLSSLALLGRSSRQNKEEGSGILEVGLGVEPSDASVERGGVAAFHCAAFGAPKEEVTVSWRKDGSSLRPDASTISVLENGTLVIRDVEGRKGVEANSEGAYQCIVSIDKGDRSLKFLSRKAHLRVIVLPRFTEQPTDRTVDVGQSVLLPCRTDSRPPPAVRWYKDGNLISPDSAYVQLPYSGSLQIVRARPEDAGSYRCKVSSQDKYRESSEGKLIVNAPQELPEPFAPIFEVKPASQVANEGDSVILECAANGYPEADISWLKVCAHLRGEARVPGRQRRGQLHPGMRRQRLPGGGHQLAQGSAHV